MNAERQSDIVQIPDSKYPRSGARLWHGMTTLNYLKLLTSGKFHVSFLRLGMAILLTIFSVPNSFLVLIQTLFFGRKIRRTQIEHAPIFVVGHWRSGTTLLHELLALDPNHAFPTTYECFAPQHFLFTTSWIPKLLWFTVPPKRPMDSMPVTFGSPQEDEFALVCMGSPSPYFRLAFPNDKPPYEEFYNMQNASPVDTERFDRDLTYFFKALTLAKKKRLILKSPTHTGRIKHLLKLFPNARFVHISRNPIHQIPSTMRMWMIMDDIQGFQPPRYSQRELLQYCIDVFGKMYDEGYFKQIDQIPVENRIELRFEDLTENPVEQIRRIYSHFGLANADEVCQKVSEYFSERVNYKRNQHRLSEDIEQQISVACSSYMKRFGYNEVPV